MMLTLTSHLSPLTSHPHPHPQPSTTTLTSRSQPELAFEVTTGGATPLHVCAMSPRGQHSMKILLQARAAAEADVDAIDTWGYTALQRCATNNVATGAQALLDAGADHLRPSGLEGRGDSARQLARRLRAFSTLRAFQQHELAGGLPLPDGEIAL